MTDTPTPPAASPVPTDWWTTLLRIAHAVADGAALHKYCRCSMCELSAHLDSQPTPTSSAPREATAVPLHDMALQLDDWIKSAVPLLQEIATGECRCGPEDACDSCVATNMLTAIPSYNADADRAGTPPCATCAELTEDISLAHEYVAAAIGNVNLDGQIAPGVAALSDHHQLLAADLATAREKCAEREQEIARLTEDRDVAYKNVVDERAWGAEHMAQYEALEQQLDRAHEALRELVLARDGMLTGTDYVEALVSATRHAREEIRLDLLELADTMTEQCDGHWVIATRVEVAKRLRTISERLKTLIPPAPGATR